MPDISDQKNGKKSFQSDEDIFDLSLNQLLFLIDKIMEEEEGDFSKRRYLETHYPGDYPKKEECCEFV